MNSAQKLRRTLQKAESLWPPSTPAETVAADIINAIINNLQIIHPSILFRLSGTGSQGQQPKQRSPGFPLPSHLHQLIWGDPKAFPGQPRDIISPACPVSTSGPPPGGTCPEHLAQEVPRSSGTEAQLQSHVLRGAISAAENPVCQ